MAREKTLSNFHNLRLKELAAIWKEFAPDTSSLLLQSVNRLIFEKLLAQTFSTSSAETAAAAAESGLYAEEENVIRYISGYIPHKLLRKYQNEQSSKASQFVECLSEMGVQGLESSFYDYTKMWIRQVDRGGLFHVNDNSYLFFRALELMTRKVLPLHLKNPLKTKELLIEDLLCDEDIQFHWSMLSVDISDNEDALQLLKEVAELWVTIRGFSIAGGWIKELNKSIKRKKSLRQTLKSEEEYDNVPDVEATADHD